MYLSLINIAASLPALGLSLKVNLNYFFTPLAKMAGKHCKFVDNLVVKRVFSDSRKKESSLIARVQTEFQAKRI